MTEFFDSDDFLKITIKEEPLEYLENVNEPIPCEIEIKDEPEDIPEFNNTAVPIPHSDHTYVQMPPEINILNNTTSPPINGKKSCSPIGVGDAPVTRKIMINGQEKTCVLVKMPQLDKNGANGMEKLRENAAKTASDVNTTDPDLKVQCPRCKKTVELKDFRQHIDTCPPKSIRKSEGKKSDDSIANHKTNGDLPQSVTAACDIAAPKDKITSDINETVQVAAYNLATGQLRTVSTHVSENENESSHCATRNIGTIKETRKQLSGKDIDPTCLTKRSQNILKHTFIKETVLAHIAKNGSSCSEPAGGDEQLSGSILEAVGLRPRSKSLSLSPYSSRISAPESEKSNSLESNERNVLLSSMAKPCSQTDCWTSIENTKSNISAVNVNSNKNNFLTRRIRTRSYYRAINEKCNSFSVDPEHLVESILEPQQSASESIRPRSKSLSVSKRISTPKADKTISVENSNQNVLLEAKEKSLLQMVNHSPVDNTKSNVPVEMVDDRQESFSTRRIRTRSCSRMMSDKSLQPEKTNISTDDNFVSRRARSKSCSRVLNKDAGTSEDNISVRRTRSKSVQRGKTGTDSTWNSLIGAEVENEKEENICHASQMSYYKKFLEVRRRCVSNKLNVGKQSVSDELKENEVGDRLNNRKKSLESGSVHVRSNDHTDKVGEPDTLDNSLLLEDNTLSCSVCSFTTDKQKKLKEHERNHRRFARPVFKCIYCNQKYTRYALYLHTQTVHPGQKFDFIEDTNTIEKSKTQMLLTEHTENHVTESGTDHLEKNQIESEPMHAEAYEQNCGKKSEEPTCRLYKCPICSYVCPIRIKMDIHERTHQKNRPIKSCPNNCSFRSTPEPLRAHLKKCIPNNTNKDTSNNHQKNRPIKSCPNNCSFRSTPEPLRAHLKKCIPNNTNKDTTNNGNKKDLPIKPSPNNCSFGSTPEPLRADLKKSIPNNTNRDADDGRKKDLPIKPSPNNCSIGSTPQPLKADLKKSIPNNTNRDADDGRKKDLPNIKHLSVKTRSKIFQCSQCDFSSKLRIKMNFHLKKNHSKGNKALVQKTGGFKCPHCSLTSKYIQNLRQHLRCHELNMPIVECDCCDYRATPTAFRTHVQQFKHWPKNQKGPKNDQDKDCSAFNFDASKKSQDTTTTKSSVKTAVEMRPQEKPLENFSCELCPFVCADLSLFKNHMTTHDQNQPNKPRSCGKTFSCQQCSYIANRMRALENHMNTHKKKQPIEKCQYCDFRSTPLALFRHIKSHNVGDRSDVSSNNDVSRQDAFSQTSIEHNLSDLQTPGIDAVPKTLFKCPQCSFSTNLRIKLKIHTKNHDNKLATSYENEKRDVLIQNAAVKRPLLRCSKCSFTTNMKSNLEVHTRQRHLNGLKSSSVSTGSEYHSTCLQSHKRNGLVGKCPDCNFKSTNKSLLRHIGKHENLKLAKEKLLNVKPKLDTTNRDQSIKKDFQRKYKNDLGETLFKCVHCPFATSLQVRLEVHLRKHRTTKSVSQHNQSIGNCPYCSYSASKTSVLRHIKRDHKNSQFADEKIGIINAKDKLHNANTNGGLHVINCEEKFINGKPVNSRKEAKSYFMLRCNMCSFVTTQNDTFREHVTTHKKNQSIDKCRHCDFRSTPRELLEHARTHNVKTKRTFYKCELCSADGLRPSNLNLHMKAHAEGQPVKQCTKCEFKSTDRLLKKHIKKGKHYNPRFLAKVEQQQHNTSSKKRLTLHSKSHSQTSIKQCPKCKFSSTPLLLSIHMREKKHFESTAHDGARTETSDLNENRHKDTVANGKIDPFMRKVKNSFNFQCDICTFSTSLRIKLNVHRNNMHPELCKKISSEIENDSDTKPDCNTRRISDDSNDLSKNHLISDNVSDPKTTEKDPVYRCTLCSYSSSHEYNLKCHVNAHKIYNLAIAQCTVCNFKGTASMMTTHKKNCTSKNLRKMILLTCDVCSFATYTPSVLKIHNDNKHKNIVKSFKCRYCSFTSYWGYLVDRHMHSHTVLKMPIKQCTKCDFKSTPAALAAHMNKCIKG